MFYLCSIFLFGVIKGRQREEEGEQFASLGTTCYQIYEDGLPLLGMGFETEQKARQRLRGIIDELQHASMGWYHVESRLPSYLPIRNVLGVRKVYATRFIRQCDVCDTKDYATGCKYSLGLALSQNERA